jgi:hypothetical protein
MLPGIQRASTRSESQQSPTTTYRRLRAPAADAKVHGMPARLPPRMSLCPLALGCVMACAKPLPPMATESALVISSPVAPGLKKPGDQPSDSTVHEGDVLLGHEKLGRTRWDHPLEGRDVLRDGEMMSVRRNSLASPFVVFASDVEQSQVPSAGWLCQILGNPVWSGAPCQESVLRKQLPDGRSVAFFTGGDAPCPLTVVSGHRVQNTKVEGITDVRLARWADRSALLVVSQWLREAGWSGTSLVVFGLDPALRRVAEIPLVEADPRSAQTLRWQMASWEIVDDGLRVIGTRTVVDRATGKRVESIEYRDHWGLVPGGRMVRAPD